MIPVIRWKENYMDCVYYRPFIGKEIRIFLIKRNRPEQNPCLFLISNILSMDLINREFL